MSQKGANYERQLKKMFEGRGFFVVRAAGSAHDSTSPDLIVLSSTKKFAIECKAWNSGNLWIDKERMDAMKEFERRTAIPFYIAWKVSREEWRFFPLITMRETGKAFTLSDKELNSGIAFDGLI
ncbi:MAG TPA: Holliday junction resolvase Hjc [Candidatus Norongarragalinales archaeon]|nr:Holliday junction resolvase Hjc [Candidatus Norongarragalinales archaeon]